MPYKFIKLPTDEIDLGRTVTVELAHDDLTVDEILDCFVSFMRACGYYVNNSEIEYRKKDVSVD